MVRTDDAPRPVIMETSVPLPPKPGSDGFSEVPLTSSPGGAAQPADVAQGMAGLALSQDSQGLVSPALQGGLYGWKYQYVTISC